MGKVIKIKNVFDDKENYYWTGFTLSNNILDSLIYNSEEDKAILLDTTKVKKNKTNIKVFLVNIDEKFNIKSEKEI